MLRIFAIKKLYLIVFLIFIHGYFDNASEKKDFEYMHRLPYLPKHLISGYML